MPTTSPSPTFAGHCVGQPNSLVEDDSPRGLHSPSVVAALDQAEDMVVQLLVEGLQVVQAEGEKQGIPTVLCHYIIFPVVH